MESKVSIIIPVYKTEGVVGRCLDSLKCQTFQDFEVIIVNDCTPDGAMKVVNDYAKTDGRIRIVEHTENKGLMCTRRTGYEVAVGKYFIFLDSDDTLPEDAVETLYKEIESNCADIVISGFQRIWESQSRCEKHYPKAIGEFTPTEAYYKLLDGSLTHNLAFCIFKSDLFKHDYITIPNQTNGEDLILFYQLVAHSKMIKSIPFITYNYFQTIGSSTRSSMTFKKLCTFATVLNFQYDFLVERNVREYAILQCIIPKAAEYYAYPYGKRVIRMLDSRIQEKLKIHRIIYYLSLKRIIKYILRRLHIIDI